jgi:hypothetical protein
MDRKNTGGSAMTNANRLAIVVSLLIAAVLLGRPLPVKALVHVGSIAFEQLDFDASHTGNVPCSEYGTARLVVTPDPRRIVYLQIGAALSGAPIWVVRNLPIMPGSSSPVDAGALIDLTALGVSRGTCIAASSIEYAVVQTRLPVDAAPSFGPPSIVTVSTGTDNAQGDIPPGVLAAPSLPAPVPPPLFRFRPGPRIFFKRRGMPSTEQGDNECGPGAVANSMHWLASVGVIDLGVETLAQTLEKLKVDMKLPGVWTGTGVGQAETIRGKLRYAKEANLPLEVHYQADATLTDVGASVSVTVGPDTVTATRDGDGGRPTFDYLLAQMAAGQDVELSLDWLDDAGDKTGGHVVVVTSAFQSGNLRVVGFSDDEHQGMAGGVRRDFRVPIENEAGYMRLGGGLPRNRVKAIYAESRAPTDHYFCYRVVDRTRQVDPSQPGPPAVIDLRDQFDQADKAYAPGDADRLCTPASKNGSAVVDAATHLKGYRLRRLAGEHVQPVVEAQDQFGTVRLHLIREVRLLVPTSKDAAAVPPAYPAPPDPSQPGYEHFKCYDAHLVGPKFPPNVVAEVVDQFGFQKVLVQRPVGFCAPVSKNGEPIHDQVRHLTCYRVKPLVPRPVPLARVLTNNQFAPEVLDVVREQDLCVPSLKTEVQIP